MEPVRGETLVNETLSALIELVARWNTASTQSAIARSVGITLSECDVRALHTIGRHGGSLRPSGLVDALGLTRPTASKVIARLETAGLITRHPDTTDGRAFTLDLTESGATAYARLVDAGTALVERAAADTGDADLASIVQFVRRLTQVTET